MTARDFAAEVAELAAALATRRDVAVARLRATHEAWARDLLGVAAAGDLVAQVRAAVEATVAPAIAAQAAAQLAAAEARQWEIGSWSTGAGEGLASMAEVRALQIAQAWLWSACVASDPDAAARARQLARAAADDPNGMADRHAAHLRALDARLDAA
ncbi:MAG: hypothetical protein H6708_29495 [Kofleriaceae bacterium]|nr:hypothetical protein [Kofleriaceae bacterium]